MRKAVFLDRDGVINRSPPEHDYVKRWEEFHFLPGVPEAIKKLNRAGFLTIVVSNQRGIARGLFTEEDLEDIHNRMLDELRSSGAHIDAIYHCPHDVDEGCGCRKPEPGMILRAAKDHDIDLACSFMVGDSTADVEAGRRAGVRTIYVGDGSCDADFHAEDLAGAVGVILGDRA